MAEKKVWIVGARETCDIVVDEPTVSGQHCRLEFVEGRLFLEDLQSTNGTFVNGERIESRTQIHPDALVTLGKSVTFAMPHQAPGPGTPPKLPQADRPFLPLSQMVLAGGSVAVVLLMLIVLVIVFVGRDSPPSHSTGIPQETSDTTESAAIASPPPPTASHTATVAASAKAIENDTAFSPVSAREAVYVLLVTDEAQEHRYRIGSAIAIGPHTLLTTGTCKTIANLAAERFPNVLLLGSRELTVQQFVPHPSYVETIVEADNAEIKLRQLLERVGQENVSNDLKQGLADAYRHFLLIDEKPHHFDLAVIRVKERIPNWLAIAEQPNLAPLARLSLVGHGFDRVAPYLPAGEVLSTDQQDARIHSTSGEGGTVEDARLLRGKLDAVTPAQHRDISWNGAGLIDSQGNLVALYSRLTPSPQLGKPANGELFDAAVVADLLPFIHRFSPL